MYIDIVNSYLDSIHALRVYADSVEEVTVEGKMQCGNYSSVIAMTMWLAKFFKLKNVNVDEVDFMDKLPDDIEISEENASRVSSLLKQLITEMGNQLEISEDGKTASYRHISKDIKEQFIRIEAENKRLELLYSGSLMLLVTYFENLVSKIIKEDLKLHPKRMSLENKEVPYYILEKANDIADVKNMLIDEEVTSLMYKALKDWMHYFCNKVKLKLNYMISIQSELSEIIARRNLIVHNEGVVNSIYLNIVGQKQSENVKKGEILDVDREYLDNAIDIIELAGVSLAIESWVKEYGNNDDEIGKITDFIYGEYLIFEKWEEAKILYEICLDSGKLKDATRLLCQINKWQCFKWQGRFDQVVEEIEDLDISAASPKFKLGVLALLDKYEEFFDYFDRQDEIGETALHEWPLFKNIRECETYIDRYVEEDED